MKIISFSAATLAVARGFAALCVCASIITVPQAAMAESGTNPDTGFQPPDAGSTQPKPDIVQPNPDTMNAGETLSTADTGGEKPGSEVVSSADVLTNAGEDTGAAQSDDVGKTRQEDVTTGLDAGGDRSPANPPAAQKSDDGGCTAGVGGRGSPATLAIVFFAAFTLTFLRRRASNVS